MELPQSDRCGVPQCFVLGPVLFVIHIMDINVGLNNFISKFADNTIIDRWVFSHHDKQSVQDDLFKISAWSDKNGNVL